VKVSNEGEEEEFENVPERCNLHCI